MKLLAERPWFQCTRSKWTIDALGDLDDLVAPESLAQLLTPLADGQIPDVAKDL